MKKTALIIGNSDGIGFALTAELLKRGWRVFGISRSDSSVVNQCYQHHVADVQNTDYAERLNAILVDMKSPDLCIYCAGIGELLDPYDMTMEERIVDVNLLGMIRTTAAVIPSMVKNGRGHFIGLSSMADEMLSPEAPSYHASKAGFSTYLESLALAIKSKGVYVTNIRFGFVDTKMAKGDLKPFMMNADRAVFHILRCFDKKPIRYNAPRFVFPLVKLRKWLLRLKTL